MSRCTTVHCVDCDVFSQTYERIRAGDAGQAHPICNTASTTNSFITFPLLQPNHVQGHAPAQLANEELHPLLKTTHQLP